MDSCHLSILHELGITGRFKPPPQFLEVFWRPPMHMWIKINTDGSSKGNPGLSGYGCVARDYKGNVMASIYGPIGNCTALEAEMVGVIMAVKIATHKGWPLVWLECDSKLVINSILKGTNSLSWRWQTQWQAVISFFLDPNHVASHIFREGNALADGLANLGVKSDFIEFSNVIPQSLYPIFLRDFCIFPSFKRL